jgi:hypothetical protein
LQADWEVDLASFARGRAQSRFGRLKSRGFPISLEVPKRKLWLTSHCPTIDQCTKLITDDGIHVLCVSALAPSALTIEGIVAMSAPLLIR